MTSYLIGALTLGFLCAAWVLIQRWITDRDPEVLGPESGCHGCGGCTGACERPEAADQLPRAEAADQLPRAEARPH